MIYLKSVTKENWVACTDLQVNKEQEEYVASNVMSIAQSNFYEYYYPTAIYDDEVLVGFLMYSFEDDCYWLFRFMIDSQYQGRGFGRAALMALINKLRSELRSSFLKVCCKPSNEVAMNLYKSTGFVFECIQDDGDRILLFNLKSTPNI